MHLRKSILLPLYIIIFFILLCSPGLIFAETYTGDININSAGGGGCVIVGEWDETTQICTLTKDILGSVNINSSNLTIDGAGHTISRNTQAVSFQRNGIVVGASNLVLKNININSFTNCIIFNSGTINGRVENSNISDCGSYGIYLPNSSGAHIFFNNNFSQNYIGIFASSSNNIIEGNSFSFHGADSVKTYFSSNNIIKNNIFLNNQIGVNIQYGTGNKVTENTIQNSISYGLYAVGSSVNENYIVNNNFINNGNGQVSVHDKNQYSEVLPIGGNYWSNYDVPSEGCNDLNVDSICDQLKYFNTYDHSYGDFYPWIRKDGWKSAPSTCSDRIQNQDETGVDIGGVCKIYSSEKVITSFSFKGLTPNVDGIINEADHTIALTVPFGTNVSALVPTTVISIGATINPNNKISQNFSNSATYTVTAEDGSIQVYIVTVVPSCITDCFSNVLFLPGIEASRLYAPRANGSEDQLWEPNGNSDVEDLYLNADGASKNSDIYTRDIIKETNTPFLMGSAGQNIYKSFTNTMSELVDNFKIADWESFAYDWRQSVDDIVDNGTKYQDGNLSLVDTLQSLVDSSKNGKVTIIAHSNGGLLAKALLKKLQDDKVAGRNNLIDKVDVLILVAVPEIGTASAVPAIMHGYDQQMMGGWLLDKIHAREFGRNMLGAFGLLPSREYINRVNASPVTFVDKAIPSGATTELVQTFGSALDSYAEYKSFLMGGEGRINPTITQTNLPIILSQDLFNKAESLHDSIDAFIPLLSLRVIEVAGWGLDTVASFEYYPKPCTASFGCGFTLDERPRKTVDGDGTVVVPSAQYMSFLGSAEKYWVDLPIHNAQLKTFRRNREHKDILEVASLNNLIQSVINKQDITFDNVLKNSEPVYIGNLLRLAIHSPVTLDAYDDNGNHTGKICPPTFDFCYVEENILNSSYLEFGEGKYISIPEDQMKSIKLQGTDIGTFTYDSEKVLPDGISTTSSFVDIPVTTQTQAEITLNPNTQEPQLALDVTGDGITDFTITPSATFDPILYLQIMKATINSLDLPQAQKIVFNNRVDDIIKSIQKGKIDQAKLKADKFKIFFENTLSKSDPKKPKPHKISKTDAQLLLDILNKLLDNLN